MTHIQHGGSTMRIGIIGAGHIGGTLTRRLGSLGHDVAVANSRGPETLAGLAAETGARAVTVEEAVRGRDLVIVTIPQHAVARLPRGLFDAAGDAVIVDTGNYYPGRDGRIADIDGGMTESGWVARQIGRPVVKAFNTIPAQRLMDRGLDAGQPAGSRFPWPATTRAQRRSCCRWWILSASTEWTRVRWTSRGASSPALPCTAPASAPKPRPARSPKRARAPEPAGGSSCDGSSECDAP
jgi:hypothetical protein